jgi:hypothetical protein
VVVVVVVCFGKKLLTYIQNQLTLNSSHIISKLSSTAMFIITDIQTIHTEFLLMFMICMHIKFHKPSSNGLLVIAIKLKTKYRLHAAAI